MTLSRLSPSLDSDVDGLPLTIARAAEALRSGDVTAVRLLEIVERRADVIDPLIGSYLTRTSESARDRAEAADRELAQGIDLGPLHGIPIAIKDIITTDEAPMSAQSRIMDTFPWEQRDAEVVRRLRAAGAVITGKTSTMEFALGAPDPSKGFPTPKNPFDLERWPGGSSSGTGNGVISGLFLGGLGTDTGGSVRLPAAWSGITGLKPTFGLVPSDGCVPLAWTYDAIGPMARSAMDCAALLSAMAAGSAHGGQGVTSPAIDYRGDLGPSLANLRVGVDRSLIDHPDCDPEIAALFDQALDDLVTAGATLVPYELPLYDEMTMVTAVGLGAEALAYHRNHLVSNWDDYGAPTRMAAAFAVMTSAADYIQAQRVRRVGVKALTRALQDVDVIVNASCLTPAPLLEGLSFASIVGAINTRYWNATGFPAVSVPMGFTSGGLPVGLHIGGRPFQDGVVLRVADCYQKVTSHHLVEPELVAQRLA